MEASALHPPARFTRLNSTAPLLKLRTDEQLVSLLRQGHDEAFRVIHDRYAQRLFAYVRQMLGASSRQDAEDVLQDVFAKAYLALLGDRREINLRPWLYRIAHNRCIDHMRRATPQTTELFENAGKALHDPFEDVQRREDLRRLVADIGRLPEFQRSALLMRELDGLSYKDLAEALEVTVPAVKSLLVRARVELVETAEARAADCEGIREELVASYDRGMRTPPRARRHLRECAPCTEYRNALRGMRSSFAALSPVATAGPLALLGKVIGFGGASGAAGAAGTGASIGAGAGASGTLVGGTVCGLSACQLAAVVSTAAITAGGAVEIERLAAERESQRTARVLAATAVPAVSNPLSPVMAPSTPRPSTLSPGLAQPPGAAAPPSTAIAGPPAPTPLPTRSVPLSAAPVLGPPAATPPVGKPTDGTVLAPVLPAPITLGPAPSVPQVVVTVPAPARSDGGESRGGEGSRPDQAPKSASGGSGGGAPAVSSQPAAPSRGESISRPDPVVVGTGGPIVVEAPVAEPTPVPDPTPVPAPAPVEAPATDGTTVPTAGDTADRTPTSTEADPVLAGTGSIVGGTETSPEPLVEDSGLVATEGATAP